MKWSSLLFVPLVIAVFAPISSGKRIAAPNPIQRAFQAEVVVVGKVASFEKELVEVDNGPNTPKIAHKIAVIKVESGLSGAANLTHVKVGFVPPAGNAPVRGGAPATLTENQEGLFFLTKHASGQFYTFNWMSSPVDATAENYKETVANVKKAFAAVADPAKAFKSDKVEDRAFTAAALLLKYRTVPNGREVTIEKVAADESKLILKGLADADWSKYDASLPAPINGFYSLALTAEDGWVQPKAQPGVDYSMEIHKAFVKWVDGPGKDYQIKKMVPKK